MPLIIVSEEPVKQKHICWFTERKSGDSRKIRLYEVRECFYRHPDALDIALIQNLEIFFIEEFNELDPAAATWVLLEASQKAIPSLWLGE